MARMHHIKRGIIRPATSGNVVLFFVATVIGGFAFGIGLNAAAKLLDRLTSSSPSTGVFTPAGTRLADQARVRLARAREATLDEQNFNAYRSAGQRYRSGWSYN